MMLDEDISHHMSSSTCLASTTWQHWRRQRDNAATRLQGCIHPRSPSAFLVSDARKCELQLLQTGCIMTIHRKRLSTHALCIPNHALICSLYRTWTAVPQKETTRRPGRHRLVGRCPHRSRQLCDEACISEAVLYPCRACSRMHNYLHFLHCGTRTPARR